MAKLLKIIMIHGHMPGVVELELDGHTNICGSNASGKTTLQRMIPVFYGELPNKVVPRTRLSFDKYYLPHKNSYVIYEYERPEYGIAQVVLTRRADGVDYRFVDAAYNPEHYLNVKGEAVVAKEYLTWAQEMRSSGIDITAKISSTTEYRNIILNDVKNDRSSRSESMKYRQLAARYALAAGKFHLRHIEKLVSAVHAKEGKMDTLKSMLAAILEEDGYSRPSHTMTGDKIRVWLRDMKQFLKIEKLQQGLLAVERISAERLQNLQVLWYLKRLVEQDYSQQQQLRADSQAEIQALKRIMAEAKNAYEQKRSALRTKINDARTDVNQKEEELDFIERCYNEFRERDMERVGRELAQLPERREKLQGLEQHYAVMIEAHQGAERELDAHKLKLSEQLTRVSSRIQGSINTHIAQQQRIAAEQIEAQQQFSEQVQQEQQALRAEYDTQLQQLQRELAAKQAQVGLSKLSEAEREQMVLAELRLEEAQQQVHTQQQHLNSLQDAVQQARKAREDADLAAKEARAGVAQSEQRVAQLELQLQPQAGSLRAFLSENVEDWQHSFGKLLAEPLLQRTDLLPQLAAAPNGDAEGIDAAGVKVMGVQLDLASVDIPPHALPEARLLEQLAQANSMLTYCNEQLAAAEKALAKAVNGAKEQQQALDMAKQQLRSLEQNVAYARDAKQRLQHEQTSLEKARTSAVKSRISELEQELSRVQSLLQNALAELAAEHEMRRLEQKAEFQELQQLQQEAITELQHELDQQRADTKAQVKDLEQAFSAQLAEQGVDSQKLNQIKQDIEQLRQHLSDIAAERDHYSAYQKFMQTEWERRRPQLQTELQQINQTLRVITAELARHEAAYAEREQADRAQMHGLKAQLEAAELQVERLAKLVARMANLPVADQAPNAAAIAGLAAADVSEHVARAQQLLDEQQKNEKRLEDGVYALEADIRKDSDITFVRFMEDSFARLGEAPDVQARVKALAEIIQIIEATRQQTIDQGKNIGNELFKFFTVFNDIHKRVGDYSRRLTQAVGDELTLDGIDKAEVKISSTIDELSFWQPLKEMINHYRQWQASGEVAPPSEYLSYLHDVAELLKANQEYSIESLIKLQLNLVENGEAVVIRNDRQLTDSSSHGMAYLILCKFLLAFTRLLRPQQAGVVLHWPIDEIGTLAYHNVEKLFVACSHNAIDIVGAFPNPESDVLLLFKHRYLIEPHEELPNKGQLKRIKPRVSALAQKLQAIHGEVPA